MDVEDLELLKKKNKLEYKIEKKRINDELKKTKKRLNKQYIRENKKLFKLFNWLLFFAILCNIGALIITNALVIKDKDVQLKEANPYAAKQLGLKVYEEGIKIVMMLMGHVIYFTSLIVYYFYYRSKIYHDSQIHVLTFLIVMVFGMTFIDFSNDLGYWIGAMIWR